MYRCITDAVNVKYNCFDSRSMLSNQSCVINIIQYTLLRIQIIFYQNKIINSPKCLASSLFYGYGPYKIVVYMFIIIIYNAIKTLLSNEISCRFFFVFLTKKCMKYTFFFFTRNVSNNERLKYTSIKYMNKTVDFRFLAKPRVLQWFTKCINTRSRKTKY